MTFRRTILLTLGIASTAFALGIGSASAMTAPTAGLAPGKTATHSALATQSRTSGCQKPVPAGIVYCAVVTATSGPGSWVSGSATTKSATTTSDHAATPAPASSYCARYLAQNAGHSYCVTASATQVGP
jgi:hypothetical protein